MDKMKKGMRVKIMIFAAFLIFLLVCTIVSRGIYAANIPMVRVGTKESKVISEKVTSNVELEAQKEIPVFSPKDLLVEDIVVSNGQMVKAGDLLMTVNMEDLDQVIEKATRSLSIEKQKLAEYDEANAKIDQKNAEAEAAKQRNIDDAAESLNRATLQYDSKIAKLQAAVSDLSAWLESHNNGMPAKDSEDYSEWKEKQQVLESSLQEKQGALEEAQEAKENELYTKQKDLERARNTSVEKSDRQSTSARMEIKDAIEEQQKQLDNLQKIKDANGEIHAAVDGVIEKIAVEIGTRTTENPVIMMGDCSNGLLAKAVIDEEQRKRISTSNKMDLSFLEGKIKIPDITIQSISIQEDGSYLVLGLVDLNTVDSYEKPENGMLGEMSLTIDSNNFDCCVPLSALHSDGKKDYILKLEEKDGFLGKQYYARKVEVTVGAKDNSYAGLKSDSIVDGDEIILESNKEVLEDKEVRLFEDE